MNQQNFPDFLVKFTNKILKLIIKPSKYKPPFDMEENFTKIYQKCVKYTMTSIERMYSLYNATKYIINHDIPGDIVECGVWKGGSMMLCAFTLLDLKDTVRKLYLYDTYEGMVEPTDDDLRALDNKPAIELLNDPNIEIREQCFCYCPLEEVKNNLFSVKYPKDHLIFVKGKIEDTVPDIIPEKISILRLDTDWYDSTYHELKFLFPNLSIGGVIIIDDYGYWSGARKAVDKYFQEKNIKILLNRIDDTGRIGVKLK